MTPAAEHRVRFRFLPWRLRRRVKGHDGVDGSDFLDVVDEPAGLVLGLFVVLLLLLLPVTLGLLLLPLELALVLLIALGELLLRALHLRPWTLAVEQRIDGRWVPVERVQRRGLAAARRERDALRAGWGGPRR